MTKVNRPLLRTDQLNRLNNESAAIETGNGREFRECTTSAAWRFYANESTPGAWNKSLGLFPKIGRHWTFLDSQSRKKKTITGRNDVNFLPPTKVQRWRRWGRSSPGNLCRCFVFTFRWIYQSVTGDVYHGATFWLHRRCKPAALIFKWATISWFKAGSKVENGKKNALMFCFREADTADQEMNVSWVIWPEKPKPATRSHVFPANSLQNFSELMSWHLNLPGHFDAGPHHSSKPSKS